MRQSACHRVSDMRHVRILSCMILMAGIAWLPLAAEELDADRAGMVRSGMTIAGAGIGLVAGSAIGIGFSLDAIDTPLSDMLFVTLPVAAVGTAAGALAGRWMIDRVLRDQPSVLFSVVEGAGLGLAAGALVGALTFATNYVLASSILDVPEGYWGNPPIPRVAMALVAGGVWGGMLGAVIGAVAIPFVTLIIGL